MPFIKEEKYNISRNCKLHSHNDMFREQEQHKIFMDYNEWKCGFCKKSFREEKYLDKHFHNRHYNLLDHVGSIFFLSHSFVSIVFLFPSMFAFVFSSPF